MRFFGRAEGVAFWTMVFLSLALLTLEYATTNFFNYNVFYVLVVGLLVKYMMEFFSFIEKKRATET